MCTMDYVTHILFRNRWEAVNCINDYMMGIADTEEDISYFPEPEPDCNSVLTCETGTQTPSEWWTNRPAQQPSQEERRRAEPLQRTLEIGTTSPNPKIRAARLS